MQYTTLGSSEVKISRIALGCMSFGDTSRGFNQWALDDKAAEPLFRQAVELGITFWDTANAYGYGTSEEITGRAIRAYTRREDVVLATKVFFKMHDGPGGSGLSRRAIVEQLDDSLRRLGTDYVDLYQIHRFDPATPVEETMEALHDMVKAGKVRYLPRRLVDVGLAVLQDAVHRRPARLDQVRLDAEPVQPHAARGRARDVRPARRPGRRIDPMEPAGQGPARPPLGRADHPQQHRRRRPLGAA
jgi:predicted oxidoreductase